MYVVVTGEIIVVTSVTLRLFNARINITSVDFFVSVPNSFFVQTFLFAVASGYQPTWFAVLTS